MPGFALNQKKPPAQKERKVGSCEGGVLTVIMPITGPPAPPRLPRTLTSECRLKLYQVDAKPCEKLSNGDTRPFHLQLIMAATSC